MGWFSSGLGGAGAGAATGAAIGSFIPGIGTAIGAGIGGLIGGVSGGVSGAESSSIDKDKNFKDLPWYDRAAATISAKTEGVTRGFAGFFGLEDSVGKDSQNLLDTLKHTGEDDYGSSFKMGSSVSAPSSGSPISAQNGATGIGGSVPSKGQSLGMKYALEDEPSLDQTNYNNNNFSF